MLKYAFVDYGGLHMSATSAASSGADQRCESTSVAYVRA
jgi:hypothetical protein